MKPPKLTEDTYEGDAVCFNCGHVADDHYTDSLRVAIDGCSFELDVPGNQKLTLCGCRSFIWPEEGKLIARIGFKP